MARVEIEFISEATVERRHLREMDHGGSHVTAVVQSTEHVKLCGCEQAHCSMLVK